MVMKARPAGGAMGAAEWLMLLALTLLWSGTFFFAKVALAELPPLTLVFARVAIAAIALNLTVIATGQRMPRDKHVWIAFFGMGTLNNLVPFSLINWGQTHIASGLASILNATTPLFTILVAHLLTGDEKLSANKIIGVLAGMAGVAVMIGLDALNGVGFGVLGELACLCAAISYAFAGVFGRRFKRMDLAPLTTATGQVTATSIMTLPIAALVDHPWAMPALPSLTTWSAVVAIALLSTALGYILYFRILAAAGATNLLLVTFLMPIGAILLGVLILGEQLFARHLVGMALIGFGLAAIDGRLIAPISTLLGRPRIAPAPIADPDG
jgi:drug/metabolite transporter (DMT)-like permease